MMKQYLSQHTEQPRLSALLLGGLGLLAVLLAAVGIYGVVSYSVAQRTQEIGIRMALGATRADVMRLVAGQASALVVLGIVVGLAAARPGVGRANVAVPGAGTRPRDVRTVACVVAVVGILASIIPARRATRVDPLVAIREV